jgi:hypothetical protein
MGSDEILISTAELASVLKEYLDHNDDTVTNLARRTATATKKALDPRAVYRVMRVETSSTTVEVAERLLHAAGRDLSDCPSYYNEGWTLAEQEAMREKLRANARKQSRTWRHGTQYGYGQKGCRCKECVEAIRRKNRLGNALRAPRAKKEKHVHPVLCALRGSAPPPWL